MMPDKTVKAPAIITSACNFRGSFPETPASMVFQKLPPWIFMHQVKEYRVNPLRHRNSITQLLQNMMGHRPRHAIIYSN